MKRTMVPALALITLLPFLYGGCGGSGGGISNHAPTAYDSSQTTDEDTPIMFNLTAIDPEDNSLSWRVNDQPTHGSLTLNGPDCTYTPDQNYYGPDQFSYHVNDGNLNSNIAFVDITIDSINDPPTAQNSNLLLDEDTSRTGSLIGNDPVEGSSLTFSIVSNPSKGKVVITDPATGLFNYTPNQNVNGSDNFSFKVNDGSSDSTNAIVSISINSINDQPVAVKDTISVRMKIPFAGTLQGSDPVEGSPVTFNIVSDGSLGTVEITNPNTGSYIYSTYSTNFGSDSFTFKVNDGETDSNIAKISIEVSDKFWGDPQVISSERSGKGAPQVAMDNAGNAIAVWAQAVDSYSYNFWSNIFTSGAGWQNPVLISSDESNQTTVGLGVSASGKAMAVWPQNENSRVNIWANDYTPLNSWDQSYIAFSTDGTIYDPKLAMNSSGAGVAVWGHLFNVRNIWASLYSAVSGWGSPEEIFTGASDQHQVAINNNGTIIATWPFNEVLASFNIGSGWSTPVPVSNYPGTGYTRPQTAIDENGNAVVVWEQPTSPEGVYANVYNVGVGWGAPEKISAGYPSNDLATPKVTYIGNGEFLAVWSEGYMYGNGITIGGSWGSPEKITLADGNVYHPQIAADGNGNAVLVWISSDQFVYSDRYLTGFGWRHNVTRISPNTRYHSYHSPKLVVNDDGDAVSVWIEPNIYGEVWANILY